MLRSPARVSRGFVVLLAGVLIVFIGVAGVLYAMNAEQERAMRIATAKDKQQHAQLLSRLRNESDDNKSLSNENTPIPSGTGSTFAPRGGAAPSKIQTSTSSPLTSKDCNDGGPHTDTADLVAIIVNKKHCIQPIDFTPALATVSCAGSGSATISTFAVSSFKQLCATAKSAGVPLGITSSYRSYQTQVSTYNYWVSTSGQAGADRYSARPGHSEHQTGLSIDFSAGAGSLDGFTGTPQQQWMAANAWRYGFIQRYTAQNSTLTGYNAESWHYRYVGTSVAAQIHNLGPSASLESLWGVSGGDYK